MELPREVVTKVRCRTCKSRRLLVVLVICLEVLRRNDVGKAVDKGECWNTFYILFGLLIFGESIYAESSRDGDPGPLSGFTSFAYEIDHKAFILCAS
jgi:hypothetical protein